MDARERCERLARCRAKSGSNCGQWKRRPQACAVRGPQALARCGLSNASPSGYAEIVEALAKLSPRRF